MLSPAMILPGGLFCKRRYKFHAEQCSMILPADGVLFQLIVLREEYIIFGESKVINALHYILRGDNYDTQGIF